MHYSFALHGQTTFNLRFTFLPPLVPVVIYCEIKFYRKSSASSYKSIKKEIPRDSLEELEAYVQKVLQRDIMQNNAQILLNTWYFVAKGMGMLSVVDEIGMARERLDNARSNKCNPPFSKVKGLMRSIAYQCIPSEIDKPN